jgi:uncharacterized phage-like protein YoqJ
MTVCFTGHRDLGTKEEKLALWNSLLSELERLIGDGATVFRAGGALGFDTAAALAVLEMKKTHPSIRLELLLPCKNQAAKWSKEQLSVYEDILSRADSYTYLSEHYYRGVMHARNRALVDGSDVCVAYLRKGASGGTAYTVDYATRRGIPVINLALN